MENLLQYIQDFLSSPLSNCLFLVLGFALSFYYTRSRFHSLPPTRVHVEDGGNGCGSGGEYQNMVFSDDDERSELQPQQSPPPQSEPQPQNQNQTQSLQPLQVLQPQFQQKSTCVVDFPSPDSSSQERARLSYENVDSEYTSHQITSISLPSSSNAPRIKYDVFISFSGCDIRQNFLSHLVAALKGKQIEVFVDDDKLKEGDELLSTLFKAIGKSQIALVIFSKDYASSKWCLKELVKINECRKKYGLIMVPIFYHVDPSDVRKQKGWLQDAFVDHEENFKDNVQEWRTTMEEVANIKGMHFPSPNPKYRTEARFIEEVVQVVLTKLKIVMFKVDIKGIVGIDKPIAELRLLISCIKSEDVGVIGIWGMGGLGKTTIACVLFNIMCSEFEGRCFLESVREQLKRDRLHEVKQKIFSMLLEENYLNTGIPIGVPTLVKRRLLCKKNFIVLDDLSHPEQFRNLIGERDWLGRGSKIIVTTRDKHVIEREADYVYEVQALKSRDALELLKLHAFNEKWPQMNWHNELMWKVLDYAKGNPLALKVLGSLLYGRSAEECQSQLQKLQKMLCADIKDVLKLSYETLDCEEQKIFLYLACFFDNHDSITKIKLLDVLCGYPIDTVLKTLQDKALITEINIWVPMHDLIREMGRSIDKSGKRKHLWDHNEFCHVLKHNQGSEHIESITLNMSRIGDINLSRDCFAKMTNLKFLRIHSSYLLPEGVGIFPSDIMLFDWDFYPSESLPESLNLENLVELRMEYSRVKKLWSGMQNLPNLKVMDLEGSQHLVELPDLSKASSLEVLDLTDCENLVSVHPSVFILRNVKYLSLNGCESLEELPAIVAMPSLTRLRLDGCEHLKCLPDSMSKLTSLKYLNLRDCDQLDTENLHIILDGLHSLRTLDLNGCRKLNKLPENISKIGNLWLRLQ